MKVLLVEDDEAIAQAIALVLTTTGFDVTRTDLGEEALDLARRRGFDIICLDLNLPDMHGNDVLKRLRAANIDTPVVILSALTEAHHKVRSLDFGADDYIAKPFHRDELLARIDAVLRRSQDHSQAVIRVGKLGIDVAAKSVDIDGVRLHLTGKEYGLLEFLALRKGTALSKEQCLSHLYGGMDEPELKIIDVFICKVRKKLAQASGGYDFIQTIWGRGYMLREPEATQLSAAA